LLCPTGTSHYSSDIVQQQQLNYTRGRKTTVEALDATKRLAIEMKNQLLCGKIDAMGHHLDEGWQLKPQLTDRTGYPTRRSAGSMRPHRPLAPWEGSW